MNFRQNKLKIHFDWLQECLNHKRKLQVLTEM